MLGRVGTSVMACIGNFLLDGRSPITTSTFQWWCGCLLIWVHRYRCVNGDNLDSERVSLTSYRSIVSPHPRLQSLFGPFLRVRDPSLHIMTPTTFALEPFFKLVSCCEINLLWIRRVFPPLGFDERREIRSGVLKRVFRQDPPSIL